MITFLFLTAFAVSIDSLVCGFSLSLQANKKLPIILCIALTVFAMCLITNYATVFFSSIITEKSACLGGLILIGVGAYNLIKKDSNSDARGNGGTISQALMTGFAVGLDGALANLSLSIMGINAFYVPLTIAVMHGLMISVGVFLADAPLTKKLAKIEFVPPIILIILGAYKLLGLFI